MEWLTFNVVGEEVLPVFGHREDAEEFLRPENPGEGWRPRETMAGEFVSILMGPCAEARRILLDPWPGADAIQASALASLEREKFMELLTGGGDPFRPAGQRSSPPPPILRVVTGGEKPGRATKPSELAEIRNPARRESVGRKGKECPTH